MPSIYEPHFLGPDGIRNRIAEIQARMRGLMGQGSQPIGAPATFDADVQPFDPTGPGVQLQGPIGRPAGAAGNAPTAELHAMIDQAAKANNVDPALLDSVVAAESSYDPMARSRAGALGLTQLMPDTAKGLGVANPFDPTQNLNGGAKYLRQLLDQFQDIPTALAAYNAGPNAVIRHGGIPPYGETKAYVSRVMAAYDAKRAS